MALQLFFSFEFCIILTTRMWASDFAFKAGHFGSHLAFVFNHVVRDSFNGFEFSS